MRIRLFANILALFLSGSVYAQIANNTNFEFLGEIPADTRDTLTTLSDTSNVVWKYPGLLSYALDVDSYWYYNGSYWKEFAQGGANNFFISGDTLYAVSLDSTFTIDLSLYLDNDTIYQFIDSLELQGDTMLRISLSDDGVPMKELDLSALNVTPTLAEVSSFSDDAAKSTYTMSSNIPVEFESSDNNTVLYIDETNERIGINRNTPSFPLDVFGKIGINGTQIIYYPQNSMDGTLVLGNGGTGFTYTSGLDGRYNTLAGIGAGQNLVNGFGNTAIGNDAFYTSTGSNSNTAIGRRAMYLNTTGNQNTSVGAFSLYSNTTGANNTSFGYQSLYNNTSGFHNSSFGYQSMFSNTTGNYNFGLGYQALYSNTTGVFNTAVGYESMRNNTTGGNNFGIGYRALRSNRSGSHNVAVGWSALSNNTTGVRNVAIGTSSGSFIADGVTVDSTGSYSVLIGNEVRVQAAGQTNQIAIGASAIGNGSNTVTLGSSSIVHHYLSGTGQVNISGGTTAQRQVGEDGDLRYNSDSTAFEGYYNAQWNTIADRDWVLSNSATSEVNDLTSVVTWANVPDANITQSSVLQHQGALTIDNIPSRRIPIGTGTGIISATGFQLTTEGTLEWYSSTGADNTGAGGGALRFLNGTSTSNSAFGIQSMGTGIKNNADLNSSFGAYSLAYITEGDYNTSLGAYSGLTLTTGSNNLFGGIYAGDNITTGSGNILLGTQAGANDATYNPDNMIAIGNRAAYNVDAANSESIFIGAESGLNEATYSDLILIGSQASATQSNQIVIGHEKTGFESTQLKSRNYRWNIDQTLGASQDGYVMTYNNTSGELELQAGSVTDGNGIFDAANDDGTIPATFEARLTDILYFSNSSGNEFMTLNGTTQQVGIGTTPSYDLDVDGTFGVSGTVRFEGYGVGLKEAADLSKTRSGYIATYATDGTLLEEEFTNPYGGESSLAGILDSLYAGQSGTEDHLMVPDASGNLAQRVGGTGDLYSVTINQEEVVNSWREFKFSQTPEATLTVGSSYITANAALEESGIKLYGSGQFLLAGEDTTGQAYGKTYMWPSRIYQQNYVEHGKIRIDSVSRNSVYVPGITRWVHNRFDPLNVPMPDSSVLVANYTVERRAGGNVNTYFDYIWKEAEADVRYRWGYDRTHGTTEHQKLYQNNPTFEIALHQNFVRIDGVKNTIDSSGVKTPINFLYTDETGKVLSSGIGALSGISFLAEDVSSSTISPATLKVITGETIGSDYAINARTSGDSLILKFFPAGLLPMSGSIADAAADQLMIIDVSESPDKAKRLTIQNMLGGSTAKTTPANAATVDFDANGLMGGKIQVNMTNVTTGITLSFSNMVDGGDYLIYFTNVTGTDTLTLPSGCINLQGDGSTVSSIDITENTYYYITYDGTNYYFR